MVETEFYYIDAPPYSMSNELLNSFADYDYALGVLPLWCGVNQFNNQQENVTGNTISELYRKTTLFNDQEAFNQIRLKCMNQFILNTMLILLHQNANVMCAAPAHRHGGRRKENATELFDSMRCVTVVIPTNTYGPSTSYFWANYQDEVPHDPTDQTIKGHIQKIKMPDPGQYLILDFDSVKTLHGVDNSLGNKNEFLCLMAETFY